MDVFSSQLSLLIDVSEQRKNVYSFFSFAQNINESQRTSNRMNGTQHSWLECIGKTVQNKLVLFIVD